MSELKHQLMLNKERSWVPCYLKSESDVVIAEKDKEIAELKKSLEQKKIAEGSVCRILWNLVDSGIIKEWYFNGEYNVLLSVDDPHIQIAELKTKIDKVSLKFCKQIRHNKYKRCLAMAKWCRESLRLMRTYEVTEDFWNLEPGQDAEYFCKKGDFYSKWRKRWLELAEKFKEEK